MAREDIFELQTRRLRLRPLRLEDWPAVQRIGGHPLVALMLANPTLIKRPVIERDGVVSVGFSKDVQASFCA